MGDHSRTCYHEAGHAILFWVLSEFPPDRVLVHSDGTGKVEITRAMNHGFRLPVEKNAMVAAAGRAAELRLDSPECMSWTDDDRHQEILWLLQEDGHLSDASDYAVVNSVHRRRQVILKSTALVDKYWDRIERLAQALRELTLQGEFTTVSMEWQEILTVLMADLAGPDATFP